MTENDYLKKGDEFYGLKGKNRTLVKLFKRTYPEDDESELAAAISLLGDYNWDVKGVDLLIKLEYSGPLVNYRDSEYLSTLLKRNNENINTSALSEDQKLDRITDLCKSEAISIDFKKVEDLVSLLKEEGPSTEL